MDLLEKQPNEIGPRVMTEGRKQKTCFCCKQKIQVGREYYMIPTTGMKRHTTCKRASPGVVKEFCVTHHSSSDYYDKRRRGGGHGYSGGDGWTRL